MTKNITYITNKNVYGIVQCKISSEFNACRYTYRSVYTPIYDVTEKIEMTKKKVAVVTGSSSGIGYETALLLARNGFDTFATMRNMNKSKEIIDVAKKENLPLRVLQLDVTDDKSVVDAIYNISKEKNSIDVLVNNAGYGFMGSVEDSSLDEIKAQFETNFFGVIRVMQKVIPIMRTQKSGTIVNVSSIAGRIGFPMGSAYVSSKFALEGLSESMSYELKQFGIKIVLIEPGVINTNFAFVTPKKVLDTNYSQLMNKLEENLFSTIANGTSPKEVANVILRAITEASPERRYLVGNDALELISARKNSTDEEFEKVIVANLLR
jgi:NAD(P)-dependent dehydrogenase (short-subunit alcohol dehydrogenase family)